MNGVSGHPILALHLPAASRVQARALAEACLRLSSQVACREPVHGPAAVFVELGRSAELLGSEARGLEARVRVLARRTGLPEPWRLGWGANAAEAYARARWGQPLAEVDGLPLAALQAYASPFQEDGESEALVGAFVAAFEDLGLRDLGGFRRLPWQSLEARFGPQAAILRARLQGPWDMAWARFEPEEALEEAVDVRSLETQQGVEGGEALLFHLKGLCDRVCARLAGRGLRAAGLRLGMRVDPARRAARWAAPTAERSLEVALPLPQGGALGMLRVLRERLEVEWRVRPLAGAVEGLSLRVLATAPGLSAQRHLWERREEEAEDWATLVNRLRQGLGEDQVFLAELVQRYLPERAWKRVLAAPQGQESPLPGRPTRFLAKPQPLRREGDWLSHTPSRRRWKVEAWEGPERLSGEWWEDEADEGFARDYYRVRTSEGESLWVYAPAGMAQAGELWWQGVFD